MKLIRILFVLCACMIAVPGLGRADTDVSLDRGDAAGAVFRYHVPAVRLTPDTVDGRVYVRPDVPGTSATNVAGAPQLPIRTVRVAVPFGANVSVSVEASGASSQLSGVPLPVPTQLWQMVAGRREITGTRTVADAKQYTRSSFTPGVLGKLVGIYVIRHQRVAEVEMYPVQAAPGAALMRSYSELTVRVSWTGGQNATVPVERNDPFEFIYRDQLVNYEAGRGFRRPQGVRIQNPLDGGNFFTASPGPWLRLRLSKRGMYQVTQSDLLAAGLSAAEISAIDLSTARVFTSFSGGPPLDEEMDCDTCFMTEIDCDVRDASGGSISGSHNFVVGDRLVFYGTATQGFPEDYNADTTSIDSTDYIRNQYTDENVYWLTWGAGATFASPPRRMTSVASLDAGAVGSPISRVAARIHLEKDIIWAPDLVNQAESLQKWEKWFWDTYSSGGPGYLVPAPGFPLPGADSTILGRVRVRVWGDGNAFYHRGYLQSRGQQIADTTWFYQSGADVVGTFTPSAGNNQFAYIVPSVWPGDPPGTNRSDDQQLAYLDVRYHRVLTPDAGFLYYRAALPGGPQGYQLSGWSAQREVYSVPNFTSLQRITGGDAAFFGHDPVGQTAYLVVEPGAMLHPTRIERSPYQGRNAVYLHDTGQGADDVILTYDAFKSYADELKSWRQTHMFANSNPRVMSVGIQQVYDEFSGGRFDPIAIRNFGRFAFRNWQSPSMTYLTLLGDASEDYKDNSRLSPNGDGITNFIPMYQNWVDDVPPQSQYSSDDFFAEVDGRHGLGFAVGRLPASSLDQAKLLVHDKTIPYEQDPEWGTWKNRYLLAADDQFLCQVPDGIGFGHLQQAEDQARNYLPSVLEIQKVYLLEYGYSITGDLCRKPGAEADFVKGLNEGCLVATFIGHGNPDQVAHEKLFSNVDLGSLNNGKRLWWFLMASCTVGKVDDHVRNGLAESVMKVKNGGAIVALAATQKAVSEGSVPMDDYILQALFDVSDGHLSHPVGLAVVDGKLENRLFAINNEKYVLQGDPALVLAASASRVGFDSTPATVQQGQLVELPITVYKNWDTTSAAVPATDFEGVDSIVIMEPPTDHQIDFGNFGYDPFLPLDYYLPAGTIFRGTGTIHNGKGTIRFVMPAGARKGPNMQVRVYGMGNRGGVATDASGVVSMATVSGAPQDSGGPAVTLQLSGDVNNVKSGDVLRITARSPYGIYLGQKPLNSVFVSIDGRGRTLLNDQFVYRPDSFTVGSVDYALPSLDPGIHTILVSAATNLATDLDGGKNRTSASLTITAGGGPPVELQNVFNFPNPVRTGETDIYFEIRDPGTAQVDVFTVAGRRIRTLRASTAGGRSRVHWNMLDEDGDGVPNGAYVFRVEVTRAGGAKSTAFGKIVVMRK